MKLTRCFGVLSLVLSLSASAQAARPLPHPIPHPVPHPIPAPGPSGPAQVEVELRHTGVVDSTFLKAHGADAILKMAEQVKKGTLPRARLEMLAGKKVAAALLSTPKHIIIRPKFFEAGEDLALNNGPIVRPHPGPTPARRMTAWHGVLSQLDHVPLAQLVDFSPARIDFTEVWDKQITFGKVDVTSPTDGPVTASLPSNSPFTIAAMRVFDGTITMTASGHPFRHVVASATHAPWTVDVNAGQDVQIQLEFAPHFDLFNFPAGWYSSTLTVNGRYWNANDPKEQPWTITVPAKGRFDGLDLNKVGLVMLNHGYDGYVIEPPSYNPRDPQIVTIPLSFLNLSAQALAGNVTASGLPTGVSMDSLHVSAGPHQTVVQNVTLRIDRSNTHGVWFWAQRTPYPFTLSLAAGPATHTLNLSMTLLPGYDHWGMNGKCGDADYTADFMMDSTGFFTFAGNGFNNNLVRGWDVNFRGGFDLDQRDDVNCGVGADRDSNFGTSYGFHRPSFEQNYQNYLGQTFYLSVQTR